MTQNKKQEIKINKLVGRIGNDYYFLDYVFKYADNFKGATGSVLEPLTKDELNELNDYYYDDDNMVDFWKQAVEAGRTTESLTDWILQVRDKQGETGGIDDSYSDTYGEQLRELLGEYDCYATNCSGGGRCFSKDMKFDEVFNQDLINLINEYEN